MSPRVRFGARLGLVGLALALSLVGGTLHIEERGLVSGGAIAAFNNKDETQLPDTTDISSSYEGRGKHTWSPRKFKGGSNCERQDATARDSIKFCREHGARQARHAASTPVEARQRASSPSFDVSSPSNVSAFLQVPLIRLSRDILNSRIYDTRVRPVLNHSDSLHIHISMSLYQLIDVVSGQTATAAESIRTLLFSTSLRNTSN